MDSDTHLTPQSSVLQCRQQFNPCPLQTAEPNALVILMRILSIKFKQEKTNEFRFLPQIAGFFLYIGSYGF